MRLREWWDDLCEAMSFAAQTLTKSPGFTAAVVLTLALGIGASSAMFTVVNSVLLRPIGFADPERLAILWEVTPEGDLNNSISPANFFDQHEQSRTFEALAAWADGERILTGGGDPGIVDRTITLNDRLVTVIRGVLVVAEVALALVLLVGTGLLARSFQKLMSVDTGLRTEQVLTMRIAARSARYRQAATLVNFTDQLQERLAALPGTRSVGIISP